MNSLFRKILINILAVSLYAALSLNMPAQTPMPAKPALPRQDRHFRNTPEMAGNKTSEKSIAVDPNVTISLCVTQGNLKVNGWNRSEVRVFVKDGAKFGFKVLQKSRLSQSPAWIKILGSEPAKGKYGSTADCVWGDEIEIDAPVNSTVNISGTETKTTIDGVKKADVNIIGGDISLRNITEGITAKTYEGDVTVEESEGSIMLDTTSGNIVVFEAGPSQIGDMFRAKTNSGAISLQGLKHRQIDVGSISGSVSYDGAILNGGTYSFNTSKGSIKMSIPADSSCQILAWYGYGNFNSEIPLKIQQEDISEGPAKRLVGLMGKGGATVKLTSNSGSILIKKR